MVLTKQTLEQNIAWENKVSRKVLVARKFYFMSLEEWGKPITLVCLCLVCDK